METIYALASGRGRAGVAVIRLSGAKSHSIIADLCGDVPPTRRASVRKLRWNNEVLDEALVLTFMPGASFTGEEAAELHIHGGTAVIAAVFSALRSFPDVRMAEAGEFTRRALEAGRLSLHEVEGLVDLIDAETEAQRKQAQRMMQGDLGKKVLEWREALLSITALIEATIDFSEEEIPAGLLGEVRLRLSVLVTGLQAELSGVQMAERIRAGFEVAIFGPPNVGKSTLVNALVGKDVAITSEIAGTTRDIIETRLDLSGLPVLLLDTAGLRESVDPVEQEGIRRAYLRVSQADLRIMVIDEEHADWNPGFDSDIVISSKADNGWRKDGALPVSAKSGNGVSDLRDWMTKRLMDLASLAGVVVNERHNAGVSAACDALQRALHMVDQRGDVELVAASLRESCGYLEALVGRIGVEDVLGEIFGRFCIGK